MLIAERFDDPLQKLIVLRQCILCEETHELPRAFAEHVVPRATMVEILAVDYQQTYIGVLRTHNRLCVIV